MIEYGCKTNSIDLIKESTIVEGDNFIRTEAYFREYYTIVKYEGNYMFWFNGYEPYKNGKIENKSFTLDHMNMKIWGSENSIERIKPINIAKPELPYKSRLELILD